MCLKLGDAPQFKCCWQFMASSIPKIAIHQQMKIACPFYGKIIYDIKAQVQKWNLGVLMGLVVMNIEYMIWVERSLIWGRKRQKNLAQPA